MKHQILITTTAKNSTKKSLSLTEGDYKDSYLANYGLRSEFKNPTVEALTHIFEYGVSQAILTKHVSGPFCCWVSIQPTVCININLLQLIHHPIKLLFISFLGHPPKHIFDQNTKMVLPEIVIEVPTANPVFILWLIVNECLHQPLSQTVSQASMWS